MLRLIIVSLCLSFFVFLSAGEENDLLHFYIVAPTQKSLETAKSLTENLIQHIKQEYDKWRFVASQLNRPISLLLHSHILLLSLCIQ
jgi:hypothetical protein